MSRTDHFAQAAAHESGVQIKVTVLNGSQITVSYTHLLKSGVMENGVVMETEEGSPQGGNLSPLLANIYLNEFDQEYQKRGVVFVRYADDIVLLAKSERAAKRLLETSTKYLEGPLKLKVNQEKSRVVSVFAIRTFKFLGFTLGKNGKGIYVRVHGKPWKKMKMCIRDRYSTKTGKTFDGVVLLADTGGKYVNFRVEQNRK